VQEPTHILAGVIIERSVQLTCGRRAWTFLLTAALAFLSHGLLDKLANFTYHPPNANFHDPFWVIYHSCVLAATVLFLCIWWRTFKLGIAFAMLPDLDWVIMHGQEIFHFRIPFYQRPHMHDLLGLIFDRTRPFSLLKIPSHRHNPWACLYEAALVLLMLGAIYLLTKPQPGPISPSRQ
jgi:hypothetical protein